MTGAPVTYLDADRAAAAFVDAIRNVRELAIDTEGASFHKFIDRVYLLQISARDRHAILDPLAVNPPVAFGEMLADARVETVFHDADYDLRLLKQDYGWRIGRLFDTRVAAQLLGVRQFGLAALLEVHFGVKLDKKHQRADWSMRPLTDDMLAYAAQDTQHLLPLKDVLRDALAKRGRLAWVEEEFAQLKDVEWAPEDPSAAFMRMKGARDLERRELAILREIFAWRNEAAAAADRASFRVINNDTLLDIARRAPRTQEALSAIRGVPRGWSPARCSEVLAAVQRGLDVLENDLPKFPRAPRWERDAHFDERVNALRTVRDDVAKDLDLDPGVLCARDRLEAVARRAPMTVDELREVRELRAWQVEVMGDAMLKAVRSRPARNERPGR